MRWIFTEDCGPSELKARQQVIDGIEKFWSDFQSNAPQIRDTLLGRGHFPIDEFLDDGIRRFLSDHVWTFSSVPDSDDIALILSVRTDLALTPILQHWKSLAPDIAGWRFFTEVPPHTLEDTKQIIEAQLGHPPKCRGFEVQSTEESGLSLKFVYPRIGFNEKQADLESNLWILTLVGERNARLFVRNVSAVPQVILKPEKGIAELGNVIKAAEAGRVSELSQLPLWQTNRSDFTFEPSDDFLFVLPHEKGELRDELQSGMGCDFLRFLLLDNFFDDGASTQQEYFLVLVVDKTNLDVGDTKQYLSTVYAGLDNELVQAELGCCPGFLIGDSRLYLYFAVTKLRPAIELIRSGVARYDVPKSSWIKFVDRRFANEWIGAYPDSPPIPEEDVHIDNPQEADDEW